MSASCSDGHARIVELLPWYLNGTLPENERQLVERHISECLPCRKAVNEERRLHALVAGSSASPDSLEHGLDRLLRRIDEAPRRPPRFVRARYALAIAASLAAIAVAFWAMLPGSPARTGEFATLTSTPDARAARADIVFRAGTSQTAIDALLLENGATVVAGPSRVGRYTIELGGEAADVERKLSALRAAPSVRLVAPAYDEGAGR